MSSERYAGKSITVINHGDRCIHSRNCVLGLPHVFVGNVDGPWIQPDNAQTDEVVAIIRSCPSGALAYERHDGGAAEPPSQVNTVHVRENGPLAFHGELHIDRERASLRATLCRCGASRHKPYCDGSHHEAGFEATGETPSQASEPLTVPGGRLVVTPLPDGPLLVQGSVEICSGTGRTISRAEQAALCRCGASGNKPFCDGSHQRVGFDSSR